MIDVGGKLLAGCGYRIVAVFPLLNERTYTVHEVGMTDEG